MSEGLLTGLFGPIVVGLVVLFGQAFLQPIIAKGVKKEETILEQRYIACNDAFNALLRKVERATVTKKDITYKAMPTENDLTAIEINSIYCRLALFGSSSSVPKKFAELLNAKSMKIRDIGEFVLNLRKEMGIKGIGVEPDKFNFAYSTKEKVPQ